MVFHTSIILVYTIVASGDGFGVATNQLQFNTIQQCRNAEQILHAEYNHKPLHIHTNCLYIKAKDEIKK